MLRKQNMDVFNDIYSRAKSQKDLGTLIDHPSMIVPQGKYTPIGLLARNEEDAAVMYLVKNYFVGDFNYLNATPHSWRWHDGGVHTYGNRLPTDAAVAYVDAGRFDQVDELIEFGACEYEIIMRCALNLEIEQVEERLKRLKDDYAIIGAAVYGYALGGHVELVEDLIRRGAKPKAAAIGYARAGFADLAENMALRCDHTWCDQFVFIAAEYNTSGQLSDVDAVLKILYLTKNPGHRYLIEYLATSNLIGLAPETFKLGSQFLSEYVYKIKRIMTKHELNFHQARALVTRGAGAIEWLFMGSQTPGLSRDCFLLIASYVFGISNEDTAQLHQFLSRYIHDGALEKIDKKYQPRHSLKIASIFFRTPDKYKRDIYERKKDELESKYDGNSRKICRN